jgi:hypothetical protein
MGPTFHSADEEREMQNSLDLQRDWAAVLPDSIGGEPLTGSGFETDEPELGFSAAKLSGEE